MVSEKVTLKLRYKNEKEHPCGTGTEVIPARMESTESLKHDRPLLVRGADERPVWTGAEGTGGCTEGCAGDAAAAKDKWARNPSLLSGVLGTGLPGLGTEHLPGALCSGTGSPVLGLCSP